MSDPVEPELIFGGDPEAPSPEVFERVRKENPPWYAALEDAYAALAGRAENAGLYADPRRRGGATIPQISRFWSLFGQEPVCALARVLPPPHTAGLPRVEQETAATLLAALKNLCAQDGELSVQTLHHDGHTGHCIRLTNYDSELDTFEYHDPWPIGSLLSEENNRRGAKAKPHGTRWRVQSDELARVIVACFVFPFHWTRAKNASGHSLAEADFRASDFFSFFHLSLLGEEPDPPVIRRGYAPKRFAEHLHLETDVRPNGRISAARLIVDRSWMRANMMLAMELATSTIRALTPTDANEGVHEQIADAIWSLRDSVAGRRFQNADPAQDTVAACVHAFVGSVARARASTTISSIDIGTFVRDGAPQLGIEITLR